MSDIPSMEDVIMANGPIKPATPADIEKDTEGITKPNLHRRLDGDIVELQPEQVAKDTHTVYVGGSNSYRGTEHYYYTSEDIVQDITANYIGDGSTKSFSLRPYVKEITSVTINGTLADVSEYTLDKACSLITFILPPANNKPIVISYKIISETP